MVRALRRHVLVRFVACLLLTWAAADLTVPELCNGEEFGQASGSTSNSQEQDDCFCCCSHTENPVTVPAVFADLAPVVPDPFLADDLAAGMPRSLYHPPLYS